MCVLNWNKFSVNEIENTVWRHFKYYKISYNFLLSGERKKEIPLNKCQVLNTRTKPFSTTLFLRLFSRLSNHFDLPRNFPRNTNSSITQPLSSISHNRRMSTRNFSIRANYNEKKEEEEEKIKEKVSVRNLSFHSSRYSSVFFRAPFINSTLIRFTHCVSPSV